MEYKNGLMEPYMKECGTKIKPMAMGSLYILMEIFMKVTGKIIRPKDSVDIKESQGDSMRAAGSRINLMGMEYKTGVMEIYITETLRMGSKMVKETMNGLMVLPTKANGQQAKLKVRVNTSIMMEGSIMENGKII